MTGRWTCWTGSPRSSGLGVPVVPWITARDGVAEFIWLLAAISATAGKIGNEVYQLQRPEIGELREAFTPGTVGSITMPHKRNPEISEHLVTLSRVIRAQAAVALDGMVCEHERDGRAWKAEWLVVPETSMAFAACAGSAARMLDGLRADPARMLANIGSHRGYLLSEPVMRALADRLGKHSAHDSVYAAAMHGLDCGQDFRTALRGDPRLDAIPTPNSTSCWMCGPSLGSCAAFVDRVRQDAREHGRDCEVAPTRDYRGDRRTTSGQPRDWRRQFRGWPRTSADRARVDLVLAPPRCTRHPGCPASWAFRCC